MNKIPEHILRQQGKVTRPEWCNCDDGFWMRNLIDPACHYHSDYSEELRDLLTSAADALQDGHGIWLVLHENCKVCRLIHELRKAAK